MTNRQDRQITRTKPYAEMTKAEKQHYNSLVGALYKNVTPIQPQSKPKKKRQHIEFTEQCKFVSFLKKINVWHYAVPNGGRRSLRDGANLRAMGVSRGTPDLVIPYVRKPYCGLYIEFKSKEKSCATPEQKAWLEFLNQQGYLAVVAYSFEDAMTIYTQYFGIEPQVA